MDGLDVGSGEGKDDALNGLKVGYEDGKDDVLDEGNYDGFRNGFCVGTTKVLEMDSRLEYLLGSWMD